MFGIDGNINRLNQQVATVVQICTVTVDVLAVEFGRGYVPDDFGVRKELWCLFLRSFGTVGTLWMDIAFARELSEVLNPDDGATTEELLLTLFELVIV